MQALVRPADPARDAPVCAAIYAPFVTGNWVSFELEPPDAAAMAGRMANYGASRRFAAVPLHHQPAAGGPPPHLRFAKTGRIFR